MNKLFCLEGIILKSSPIFEKDKRVELFTLEKGKQCLLAKYANTKEFKFGAKLDPFHHVKCYIFQGKTFGLIQNIDLIQSFSGIRTQFNRLNIGCQLLDIIKKGTVEHQENPSLFYILQQHLEHLNESQTPETIRHSFDYAFLKNEGLVQQNHHPSPTEAHQMIESYCKQPLIQPIFSPTQAS